MKQEATIYKQKLSAFKCVVVIPTYNNAETLAAVVADVKQYSSDIIVVNDGSTDHTSDILSTIKDITVIDYPKNRGKGYALKLGLQRACALVYRSAIPIDSRRPAFPRRLPRIHRSYRTIARLIADRSQKPDRR